MKILPFLFLICLMAACGPSVQERKAAVDTAFVIYQSVPVDSAAATLMTALWEYNNSRAKMEDKNMTNDTIVKYISQSMFNDSTFRLNEKRARFYIAVCDTIVRSEPDLAKAPDYLHHAAETARTLRDIPKAIELYDWIIDKYPNHPKASISLFLKAFTYDNDLNEFDKGGEYYNEYLTKYPSGEFSESARFLLDNLGKSEEELLKKMMEQQKKEEVVQ